MNLTAPASAKGQPLENEIPTIPPKPAYTPAMTARMTILGIDWFALEKEN